MANYYPDQSTILPMCTIRRERLLPEDVYGTVTVREGEHVNAMNVVARGVRANRYVILNLRQLLGVDNLEELETMVHIAPGEAFKEGQVIAGDQEHSRRLVRAPVSGMMLRLLEGRMVLQTGLTEVTVRAGFNGQVTSIRANHGVLLETTGALVQGVWGNGRDHFGVLQKEPEGGLAMLEVDEFATEWRGAIVITERPLVTLALRKAEAQGLGGIIAPSMNADLREVALRLKMPIMLTEGFGNLKMGRLVSGVLEQYVGRQAALNAVKPERGQANRPEVIVPLHTDDRVAAPARNEPLRIGSEVRLTRAPFQGIVGKVTSLPATPQVIENGLRLPVAQVNLPSGRTVTVPLVNLEMFGRG